MDQAPNIIALDGERSRRWVDALARFECPAFTARRARRAAETGTSHDPIVWTAARGVNVTDADGNRYVDLTSGFGVAAVGHAHPKIVEAIQTQSATLIHALGDLHPSDVKVKLLERLCTLAPFPARAVLSLNGGDAVETALKTAVLHTGRPGILAFEGGYHGLALGPLAACGYSVAFRAPFKDQLNPHVEFAAWPTAVADLETLDEAIANAGCVLIEPIQGRGGVRMLPNGFLAALKTRCRAHGTLLVVDEIFTGLARCGTRWASEDHADLLCVGKALGGGMPVSACLGREEIMRAWGDPKGEAIHTGTFFGQPLGCASALACLDVIDDEGLIARARELGAWWQGELHARDLCARGSGLMIGVALGAPGAALRVSRRLLERGYLALPAGADADVLQLVPPLTIERATLLRFTDVLREVIDV